MIGNEISSDELPRLLVIAMAAAFIAYIAITIFQVGFLQGERNAAKKRTVTVYDFLQHKKAGEGRAQAETGDSDSEKLRAPETPEAS